MDEHIAVCEDGLAVGLDVERVGAGVVAESEVSGLVVLSEGGGSSWGGESAGEEEAEGDDGCGELHGCGC